MFAEYLFDCAGARYETRVILIDEDQILDRTDWKDVFTGNGYKVLPYENDLRFRIDYEDVWKAGQDHFVFAVLPGVYVPYDIRKKAKEVRVSFRNLFPRLNGSTLKERSDLNLELLTMAGRKIFDDFSSAAATKRFLSQRVYSRENVGDYIQDCMKKLKEELAGASRYED